MADAEGDDDQVVAVLDCHEGHHESNTASILCEDNDEVYQLSVPVYCTTNQYRPSAADDPANMANKRHSHPLQIGMKYSS